MEPLFTEGLQRGLNANIGAYLGEQLGKNVPYAVVSDGWHCFLGAAKGMTHTEWMLTCCKILFIENSRCQFIKKKSQ